MEKGKKTTISKISINKNKIGPFSINQRIRGSFSQKQTKHEATFHINVEREAVPKRLAIGWIERRRRRRRRNDELWRGG